MGGRYQTQVIAEDGAELRSLCTTKIAEKFAEPQRACLTQRAENRPDSHREEGRTQGNKDGRSTSRKDQSTKVRQHGMGATVGVKIHDIL